MVRVGRRRAATAGGGARLAGSSRIAFELGPFDAASSALGARRSQLRARTVNRVWKR